MPNRQHVRVPWSKKWHWVCNSEADSVFGDRFVRKEVTEIEVTSLRIASAGYRVNRRGSASVRGKSLVLDMHGFILRVPFSFAKEYFPELLDLSKADDSGKIDFTFKTKVTKRAQWS
jgi:hypothetical protein